MYYIDRHISHLDPFFLAFWVFGWFCYFFLTFCMGSATTRQTYHLTLARVATAAITTRLYNDGKKLVTGHKIWQRLQNHVLLHAQLALWEVAWSFWLHWQTHSFPHLHSDFWQVHWLSFIQGQGIFDNFWGDVKVMKKRFCKGEAPF